MKRSTVAVLALLTISLAGCSDAGSVLHGTVSYRGRPVLSGAIIVLNEDGRAHSGVIQPDGAYRVEHVGRGNVRIGVLSPDPAKARSIVKSDADDGKNKSRAKSAQGKERGGWFPLPRDTGDPQKSGIACPVDSGNVRYDIVIP